MKRQDIMLSKIIGVISLSPSIEETGPNLRIFNLAKTLCNIYNKVKIMVFYLGDKSFIYNNCIYVIGINSLRYVKKSWPTFLKLLFIQIPYSITLIKILDKLNVSVVVISESHTLGFFVSLILFLARKLKYLKSLSLTILDKHNIYYNLVAEALRIKGKVAITYRILSRIVKLLELIECKFNDAIFVVSKEDARYIHKYVRPSRYLFIIPNVVELPMLSQNMSSVSSVKEKLGIADDQSVLLFIGGLNYLPNFDAVLLFLKKIFPKLAKCGNIVFIVVGRSGKRMTFEFLNKCKVIFTDYVEDITPYMLVADLCVVPLRIGSGTRLKILTCMAYGKAVISTPKGAEGLDLMNGRDIIISDIEEFHKLISTIIRKPSFIEYVGRNARATIERRYSLRILSKRLYVILRFLGCDLG